MIAHLRDVERERLALVERSNAQRATLAVAAAPLAHKLATLDRIAAAVRAHPVLVGLAAGALASLGPSRLLAWAARAAMAYSVLRRG